jgi:hypothetical protein
MEQDFGSMADYNAKLVDLEERLKEKFEEKSAMLDTKKSMLKATISKQNAEIVEFKAFVEGL